LGARTTPAGTAHIMGDYQHDKRICVYPAYLNSTLTVAQGRKIPAYLATENPSAHEVYESAMRLGLKCQLEVRLVPASAHGTEAGGGAAVGWRCRQVQGGCGGDAEAAAAWLRCRTRATRATTWCGGASAWSSRTRTARRPTKNAPHVRPLTRNAHAGLQRCVAAFGAPR
jgi:hypothetical protein